MTKKLILLMLALPMVLMIALFSATKAVSYSIGISVSDIKIIKESNVIYLDLDSSESYKLDYAVMPTNAANKAVSVSTEAYGTAHLAEFDFADDKEGSITVTPKSSGAAKVVLTTADGGFSDSIVIFVDSNTLTSIDCTASSSSLLVGETAEITTTFSPSRPSNSILNYETSDSSILKVDASGKVTALSKGTATVTVTADADPNIKQTLTFTVTNSDVLDIAFPKIAIWNTAGSFPLSIDAPNGTYSLAISVLDEQGNPTDALTAQVDESGASPILQYQFTDESFLGSVTIKITLTEEGKAPVTKECTVERIKELTASFDKTVYQIDVNSQITVPFTVIPEDATIDYSVEVSGNLFTVSKGYSAIRVNSGAKVGKSTVTLTLWSTEHPELTTQISTEILVTPRQIAIDEESNYGIEKILTIGKYDSFDYSLNTGVLYNHKLNYSFNGMQDSEGVGGFIFWSSSEPDHIAIDNNGNISFLDDTFSGIVEFTVKFSYGGIEEISQPFKIRCVANGVNVNSYLELVSVTKAERHEVVLMNNIIDDFGKTEDGALITESEITSITTTYDKTYYDNIGKEEDAKVKILIHFKKNVYGNGYIINSDNISYKSGYFKGPLNFVAATNATGNTQVSIASVKGQDNISFAVYEDVTLNNVNLQAYEIEEEDEFELHSLNLVGTTVEVLGDNVNIEYSRISNGRTALRIFGDISDPTKIIHVNIKNSVLSRARDFIIRMGSNHFVDGDIALPEDTSGSAYNNKLIYNDNEKLPPDKKQEHDNNFIKTFVSVENSVFQDAGIFAIGIDSHFSGGLLQNGSASSSFKNYLTGWENLAKTSYGAKLTLKGDVRLYNWNPTAGDGAINSETLIEVTDESFNWLTLDVRSMINSAAAKPDNENILYYEKDELGNQVYAKDKDGNIAKDQDGNPLPLTYVHAGIAFFGGGNNYGVIDMSKYNSPINIDLIGYEISLADANRGELASAAGDQPFYFLLANRDGNFTPKEQRDLSSDYSCIYKEYKNN